MPLCTVPDTPPAPESLPTERLEAEICELAGRLWAAECRWLLMLAEFERREGWGAWGIRSCAHWLSWRCGLGLVAAREKVRVAKRLPELPLVTAAFSRGELSYAKVRALSRVAGPDNEAQLLEMARYATAPQLERIASAYRSARKGEETKDTNDRHDRRQFSWYTDEDGSVVFSGRLDPEDGAVVVAAIEAVRQPPVVPARDSMEASPAAATKADALVAVSRAALAHLAGEGLAPEPVLVVVHVDEGALAGSDDGRSHLEGGGRLDPETVRRLACDGAVVHMVDSGGPAEGPGVTPLDVGRRTRSIPPAIRRALRVRDGGCRFPGCTNRRFVDGHHIVHWAHGGETKLTNLISMCRVHHRLVHEAGYRLTTPRANVFRFERRDGRPIPHTPTVTIDQGRTLEDEQRAAGLDIGPDTCRSLGEGASFDLGLTIDVLMT